MVKVRVISYRDELRMKRWPSVLCCRPMIGDYIKTEEPYSCIEGRIIKISHYNESEENDEPKLELTVVSDTFVSDTFSR